MQRSPLVIEQLKGLPRNQGQQLKGVTIRARNRKIFQRSDALEERLRFVEHSAPDPAKTTRQYIVQAVVQKYAGESVRRGNSTAVHKKDRLEYKTLGTYVNEISDTVMKDIEDYYGDEGLENIVAIRVLFIDTPREGGARCTCLLNAESARGKHLHGMNDCLWSALRDAFQNDVPVPGSSALGKFKVDGPASFKRYLGVPREDPVSMDLMPAVSTLLGKTVRLDVVGDEAYSGPVHSCFQRHVTINFEAGHYTLHRSKGKAYGYAYAGKLRTPAVITQGEIHWRGADGQLMSRPVTDEEWNNRGGGGGEFMVIKHDEHRSPEEDLAEFEEMAEATDQLFSGPETNVYRATGSLPLCASALLEPYAETLKGEMEDIGPMEALWNNASMKGPSCGYGGNYDGLAVGYDINSSFPAMMAALRLLLPTRAGTFTELDVLPEHPSVGIYRVHALRELDNTTDRARMFCRGNTPRKHTVYPDELSGEVRVSYMTQHTIHAMRLAGLTVELVHDGRPNALLYGPDKRTQAANVFGGFVADVYAKKQANKKVKLVLNAAYGMLTMKNRTYVSAGEGDELPGRILEWHPSADGTKHRFVCAKPGAGMYRFAKFARMGPFIKDAALLACGRLMHKDAARVLRWHTDGFVLAGPEPCSTPIDPAALGALKQEHTGHVTITGVNRCEWE